MRAGWSLPMVLLWCFAAAFGSGGAAAAPDAEGEERRTLSAVFQSKRGGLALIDGVTYRPGDRIGGAELLAVERGAIRLRTGDGEYTAWVGFELPDGYAALPPTPPLPALDSPVLAANASEPGPAAGADSGPVADSHTVAYGDTLSTIANRYRPEGMALDLVISAILEANSAVIGDDIDTIYAGAELMIPDLVPAIDVDRTLAVPGLDADSNPTDRPESEAVAELAREYGPVRLGDTLSGIAQTLNVPGISSEALMRAIFEANPDAFGGSMDMLFAGEVLRIPPSVWLPGSFATGRGTLARLETARERDD
ncbi:MAG: LysM peptidoglycan-binding domain-containing protein [Pseudomonadota bacterium]